MRPAVPVVRRRVVRSDEEGADVKHLLWAIPAAGLGALVAWGCADWIAVRRRWAAR